jgi:hypothetical protein
MGRRLARRADPLIGLLGSLARIAGVLAAAWIAGALSCSGVCPPERESRAERFGWSWALGAGLTAAMVPLALFVGIEPGWVAFLVLAALAVAAGRVFRVDATEPAHPANEASSVTALRPLLAALVGLGILLYLLRALTEPMWANDFVAIWGLKGKIIYASGALPRGLFEDPALGFSHPEYPLGLPFLYAGVSFLAGRWDDHAMGLLFPVFQAATLSILFGWLRRRGASRTVALFAAATLACFEPLYSAFLTGMAEVPLSLGLLLFGTSLVDAVDGEPGALRRLAVASAWITATKNEGLFFAAAGAVFALIFGGRRRGKVALASLPTALAIRALHLAWSGSQPLRDFDVHSFSPDRLLQALRAASALVTPGGWAALALVAVLVALGHPDRASSRLLGLTACGLGAYLVLPAFAVGGPGWLVATSLPRTSAGLVPLAAAAVAARYAAAPSAPVNPADP